MDSNCNSGSRAHIKRPMNSFMVWSREKRCDILRKHPGINNAIVSKTLGAAWKKLSDEEKEPYVQEAQRLADLHKTEHPEYKYRPRRKKMRQRSIKSIASPRPSLSLSPYASPSPCMCSHYKNSVDHSCARSPWPLTVSYRPHCYLGSHQCYQHSNDISADKLYPISHYDTEDELRRRIETKFTDVLNSRESSRYHGLYSYPISSNLLREVDYTRSLKLLKPI